MDFAQATLKRASIKSVRQNNNTQHCMQQISKHW